MIMGLFSQSGASTSSPESSFWKWFEKNEKMLFNFEKNTEKVFDKLSAKITKVDPELTFEFSPIRENGKREFVISAGGIKSSFPSVESLFESAPKLDRWTFIKYRSRRDPLNDLEYGGKSIAADNVHFKLYEDGGKAGIVIFLDGYNEKERDIYGNIGYLFLDEALGEYDIEMRVGFIEFHNRESEHYEGAWPLSELATHFDEYFTS